MNHKSLSISLIQKQTTLEPTRPGVQFRSLTEDLYTVRHGGLRIAPLAPPIKLQDGRQAYGVRQQALKHISYILADSLNEQSFNQEWTAFLDLV